MGVFSQAEIVAVGGDPTSLRSLGGAIPQVPTAPYVGAPTITDLQTTTSSISGSVLAGFDNPAFTHLGSSLTIDADTRFLRSVAPSANLLVTTWTTDAPVQELFLSQAVSRYFIEVLDTGTGGYQPAMSGGASFPGPAGTPTLVKIDFGTARRARSFRFSAKGGYFGGVRLGSADTIWPTIDLRPLMVAQGDSYTDGTGASNARMLTYAATTARLMGWQFWSEGVGGTGYTTQGATSLATRVTTLINTLTRRVAGVNTIVTPDQYMWPFGYNDAGQPTANILAGFDAAYAAANKKPTCIWGPWTPAGTTTNLETIRAALRDKAASLNIPFLDIASWVNLNNQATLQNVAGGDPVHPVQIGHDYLGFRGTQGLTALGFR